MEDLVKNHRNILIHILIFAPVVIFQFMFSHSLIILFSSDSPHYVRGAEGILSGNGFGRIPPDRLPIYPLFLAALKYLFGGPLGRELLYILGFINIIGFIFVYKSINIFSKTKIIPIIVVYFYAMNQGFFSAHSAFLGPENLTFTQAAIAIYFTLLFIYRVRKVLYFALALSFAVFMALTRPEGILLTALAFGAMTGFNIWQIRKQGWRPIAKAVISFSAIFLVISTPLLAWCGFNYTRYGIFSPTAYGGVALYWGVVLQTGYLDREHDVTKEVIERYWDREEYNKDSFQNLRPQALRIALGNDGYKLKQADEIIKSIAIAALKKHLFDFTLFYIEKLSLATKNIFSYCNPNKPFFYSLKTNALTTTGTALPFVVDVRGDPDLERISPFVDYTRMISGVDGINYITSIYIYHQQNIFRQILNTNQWYYFGILMFGLIILIFYHNDNFKLSLFIFLFLTVFLFISFYVGPKLHRTYTSIAPFMLSFVLQALYSSAKFFAGLSSQFRFNNLAFILKLALHLAFATLVAISATMILFEAFSLINSPYL